LGEVEQKDVAINHPNAASLTIAGVWELEEVRKVLSPLNKARRLKPTQEMIYRRLSHRKIVRRLPRIRRIVGPYFVDAMWAALLGKTNNASRQGRFSRVVVCNDSDAAGEGLVIFHFIFLRSFRGAAARSSSLLLFLWWVCYPYLYERTPSNS
jgi:hypothetical protein